MFTEFSHFNAQLFGLLAHQQRLQQRKKRRREDDDPSADLPNSSDADPSSKKTKLHLRPSSPLPPSAISPSTSTPPSDSDAEPDNDDGETPHHSLPSASDALDDADDGDAPPYHSSASSHLAFLRYLSRHRRELTRLHPDATDEEVDDRAQEKWMKLSKKERREYEAQVKSTAHKSPQRTVDGSGGSSTQRGDSGKADSRERPSASTSAAAVH